jgi:hypothetical protein
MCRLERLQAQRLVLQRFLSYLVQAAVDLGIARTRFERVARYKTAGRCCFAALYNRPDA